MALAHSPQSRWPPRQALSAAKPLHLEPLRNDTSQKRLREGGLLCVSPRAEEKNTFFPGKYSQKGVSLVLLSSAVFLTLTCPPLLVPRSSNGNISAKATKNAGKNKQRRRKKKNGKAGECGLVNRSQRRCKRCFLMPSSAAGA